MPTADLVDGRIEVADVEYRDRDAIREIPGSRWRDGWSVPVSWPAVVMLRSVFGERLRIEQDLKLWLWGEYNSRIFPTLSAREVALREDGDTSGDPRLYPLQRTGVWFMQNSQGCILSDCMGLGKTLEAITTLEVGHLFPALVVCPNSVKRVWRDEYAKWYPDRKVVIVTGGAGKRRKALEQEADVYVTNWEAIRLHSRIGGYGSIKLTDAEKAAKELNRPWRAVIADEAHRALNPKAKQTRALWAIGDTAQVRYALTGTPIADTPDDLWALLHFVAPHEWPSKTKFIDRYCLTSWNAFGGVEIIGLRPDRREELFTLIDPRILRRPKAWLKLPEKMPAVKRYVAMTPKQKTAYDQFAEDYFADVEGGMMMSFSPLTASIRLGQLASSCCEVQEDGEVHMCAPSSKVNELLDVLAEMGDEPAVVFAASRQLIGLAAAALQAAGITHSTVVGGQSDLQRDVEIDNFKEGRARVILLTYGAGAEGLTLTQASTIIFMQRSWSMIENKQAEERVHRPGQDKNVTVIDLITEDSIEEHQCAAVGDKHVRLQEIVRDKESLREVIHVRR
jgi:SNF2 family DNA or RNA helicase